MLDFGPESLQEKSKRALETPPSLLGKLGLSDDMEKVGISEGRIKASIDKTRELVSFFREYPDHFLDLMSDPREKFSFFFYQRMFLRAVMRHRYTYATFPRAYSKSFLSILALYVRCILYPNSKVFIASGGKEQSAKIATEKLDEIWKFFPALKNELNWDRGPEGSKMQRDYINLRFKNGSYLDIVAAQQSARGGRRTSGLMEEAAQIPGQILSEVILPMMNVSRRAAFGGEDKNDITNKGQIYITTAGEKGTFAYEKLVQIFLWSIARPNESFVMGGTWRVPVLHGLASQNFVDDLKEDGTFSELTFMREYESVWGGGNVNSFFSGADFDQSRTLEEALVNGGSANPSDRMVFAYDVGRLHDQSSMIMINLKKFGGGSNAATTFIKQVANIVNFDGMHFRDQANAIKRHIMLYRPEKLIIDANGIGLGLVDFLTVETIDPNTGEKLPAIGVDPDSDKTGEYKKFYRTPSGFDEMIYMVKATAGFNYEIASLLSAQIQSGKIQFLIDDQLKFDKVRRTDRWKNMTDVQKVLELKPYKLTKLLREETLNMKKRGNGASGMDQIAPGMKKDMYSSLSYGIWYARQLELKNAANLKGLEELNLTSGGGGVRNGQRRSSNFKRSSRFKRGG